MAILIGMIINTHPKYMSAEKPKDHKLPGKFIENKPENIQIDNKFAYAYICFMNIIQVAKFQIYISHQDFFL